MTTREKMGGISYNDNKGMLWMEGTKTIGLAFLRRDSSMKDISAFERWRGVRCIHIIVIRRQENV